MAIFKVLSIELMFKLKCFNVRHIYRGYDISPQIILVGENFNSEKIMFCWIVFQFKKIFCRKVF